MIGFRGPRYIVSKRVMNAQSICSCTPTTRRRPPAERVTTSHALLTAEVDGDQLSEMASTGLPHHRGGRQRDHSQLDLARTRRAATSPSSPVLRQHPPLAQSATDETFLSPRLMYFQPQLHQGTVPHWPAA